MRQIDDSSLYSFNMEKKEGNIEVYKLRVLMEAKELNERLGRLQIFFNTDTFVGFDVAEQDRMRRQTRAMTDYLNILNERIEAF